MMRMDRNPGSQLLNPTRCLISDQVETEGEAEDLVANPRLGSLPGNPLWGGRFEAPGVLGGTSSEKQGKRVLM